MRICHLIMFMCFGHIYAQTTCPGGKYYSIYSQRCKKCQFGQYLNAWATGCYNYCHPGTQPYVPYPGFKPKKCEYCPAGYYSDRWIDWKYDGHDENDKCTQCSAGQYQNETGQTSCKPCGNNTYSVSGQIQCNNTCPVGFQVNTRTNKCDACPEGYYKNTVDAQPCSKCAAGYHQSSTGNTACAECTAGKYVNQTGQRNCDECPNGQYQSATGQTSCDNCNQATSPDHTTCNAICDGGHQKINTQCVQCNPGRYGDGYACRLCREQTYQYEYARAYCTTCPPGQRINSASFDDEGCRTCPAGYIKNINNGVPRCKNTSTDDFINCPNSCTTCTAGKYENKGRCLPCGKVKVAKSIIGVGARDEQWEIRENSRFSIDDYGYVSKISIENATSCPYWHCKHGAGNSRPGASSIHSCTWKCPKGTQELTVNPTGWYRGAKICAHCPAGWFNPVKNGTCAQCPGGWQQPDTGSAACFRRCFAGQVANENQERCVNCQVGYYQDELGQKTCKACTTGQHQNNTGTSSCKVCTTGKYQDEQGQQTCKPCPVGKYVNQNGTDVCDACPEGTFQDVVKSTECKPCSAGRFGKFTTRQPDSEDTACKDCIAGYYQNLTGQKTCNKCETNYSPAGASNCTYNEYDCPRGTEPKNIAFGGEFILACAGCSRGKYSNDSAACKQCDAGQYQNEVGQTTCKLCTGKYSTAGDWECRYNVTECPDGTGASASNACEACPGGKYSDETASQNAGQNICKNCPAGRYHNKTSRWDMDQCLFCIGDTYSPEGQTECAYTNDTCPQGTEPDINQGAYQTGACLPCLPGLYSSDTFACKQCAAGQYQDEAGQTECKNCTGNYSTTGKDSCDYDTCPPGTGFELPYACITCVAGRYSDSGTCAQCPGGWTAPGANNNECKTCGVGNFAENATRPCQACPYGWVNNIPISYQCTECLSTQQPNPTRTACEPLQQSSCKKGEYGDKSRWLEDICQECPEGWYQDEEQQWECKGCPSGYFAKNRIVECVTCPEGFFQNQANQPSCSKCPNGWWTDWEDTSANTQCSNSIISLEYYADLSNPSEYYPTVRHAKKCDTLPVGTVCREESAGNVIQYCNPGNFMQTDGICSACPTGWYQNKRGRTSCDSCPAGYHQSNEGQTQCNSCVAGKYEDVTGQSSCKNCNTGHYQENYGHDQCKVCPAGYHQPDAGKTQCVSCAAGYHQSNEGQSDCTACVAGQYAPPYSSAQISEQICLACAAGFFQSQSGQTICIACDAGQYQNNTGQRDCKDCAPGKYQRNTGQLTCTDCDAGQYQNQSGQLTCIDCDAGQFQETSGQNSCTDCVPGQFQGTSGQTNCIACDAGQYQNNTGQRDCTSCDAGQYQSQSGQQTCTYCNAGQYQSELGEVTCTDCDTGRFGNTTGALSNSSCHACPEGYYEDDVGQPKCQKCPAGTYTTEIATDAQCKFCSEGQFSANITSACQNCSSGHYQDEMAASQWQCKTCAAGQYARNSRTSCEPCPSGKFQDKNVTSEYMCKSCPENYYTVNPAANDCKACPTGYVSDEKVFCRSSLTQDYLIKNTSSLISELPEAYSLLQMYMQADRLDHARHRYIIAVYIAHTLSNITGNIFSPDDIANAAYGYFDRVANFSAEYEQDLIARISNRLKSSFTVTSDHYHGTIIKTFTNPDTAFSLTRNATLTPDKFILTSATPNSTGFVSFVYGSRRYTINMKTILDNPVGGGRRRLNEEVDCNNTIQFESTRNGDSATVIFAVNAVSGCFWNTSSQQMEPCPANHKCAGASLGKEPEAFKCFEYGNNTCFTCVEAVNAWHDVENICQTTQEIPRLKQLYNTHCSLC